MYASKNIRKAFIAVLISLFLVIAVMFTLSACGQKTLDKIEVTIPPVKVEYIEGEKFNPAGMVVTAYYSDNSQAVVTDYTLRPDVTTKLDSTYNTVTVFYVEGGITKSADIDITVKTKKTPYSAVIAKMPRLTYSAGETFSVEGMEWTVVYTDASIGTVTFTEDTQYTVDITRPLKVGDSTVNVTYGGVTLPVIIAVGPKSAVDANIITLPRTVYKEGEYFDVTGLVWEIIYSDNSKETVTFNSYTDCRIVPSGKLDADDTSVLITYKDRTRLIDITVYDASAFTGPIIRREIVEYCKTEYFDGEEFDISGLKVNFVYESGASEVITFNKYDASYTPHTLYVGCTSVTVDYKGYNVYVPVSVIYPPVEDITIKTLPNKTKYIAGEKFDPTGMVVTVIWEDGYKHDYDATSSYFTIPSAPLTEDTTKVTVIYNYYHGDFYNPDEVPVDVPVTVVGIEDVTVKTLPDKTQYVAGESFDPKGMVVTVTYSDSTSEDVEITRNSNVLFPEEAIKATDTSVAVFYAYTIYGAEFRLEIDIEIINGVYIEAENALIDSTNYEINDNAQDKNGINNASGGKYVADMKAGNSITFSFNADAAGKGEIAFVLASQYLKQDKDWTPIVMGDCQFNKICEFWLNGEKQVIADSVILPGGEADDKVNGERWLWYNWKEVVFEEVQFIAGRNDVVLKFIEHDYDDCSQTSFNKRFTANVDSLKITSAECEVSPCDFSLSFTDLNASLSADGNTVYYVIEAKANYVDLTQDEVIERINFQLRLNKNLFGGNWNEYLDNAENHIINFTDDTHFTFKVALNSLDAGGYLTRFGLKPDEDIEDLVLDSSAVNEQKLYIDGYFYYLIAEPEDSGYYGCVALVKESASHVESYTAEGIVLEEQDEQAVLVITGEIIYTDFTEGEAAEAFENVAKVALYNSSARLPLEIISVNISNAQLTDTDGYGVKYYGADYTLTVVLSEVRLKGTYYVSYKNTDKIVFEDTIISAQINVGSFIYSMSEYQGNGYPVIAVETAGNASFSIEAVTDVKLRVEDGKPVYILEGYYSSNIYTSSEIKALIAQEYFDLQKNPDAAGDGSSSWTAMHPSVISVTLSGSSFEIRYDLSSLPDYCYTSHFGQAYNNKGELAGKNVTLSEFKNSYITVGNVKYYIISDPNGYYDGTRYWGSVGIKKINVFNDISQVNLEVHDGKPYLALCGNYYSAPCTDEEALIYLQQACANIYADFTNNPNNEFGSTDGSWATTVLSVESETIKFFAKDGEFKILLDLSSAKSGQVLFSHLSFSGLKSANFKCGYGTVDKIFAGGRTYSLVETFFIVDSWDWQYGLVMVKVS